MATGKLAQRTLRSPLGRVRGLGAAKEGAHHWWVQRLTAVALVPLTLWFIASVIVLAGASHGEVVLWMARPHNTVLLLVLIGATFWHGALGLQVVIEDYIRSDGTRLAAMLAMKAAMLLLALFAAIAVLKVAL
ncbi:succinate dehydrogenase, hydrophobic membrane anchor protein [Elioraea sp.]|uniref:succinate dehydrogenase, hydrophobic membrane anchor protein n=1 Tax=Elioraea sp. TaxID=2185103 RepID=UPI003F70244F